MSENFLPELLNLGLKIPHFGGIKEQNYNFSTHISSVGHLQLSVGKLQLPAIQIFSILDPDECGQWMAA